MPTLMASMRMHSLLGEASRHCARATLRLARARSTLSAGPAAPGKSGLAPWTIAGYAERPLQK